MADEFGGEELNTDDFGGIAIEQEPKEEPSQPSALKQFGQMLVPIGETQEFLKKQNEKLAPIGKALDWAGKQVGRNLKTQAFLAIGEPELAAQQIGIPEEYLKRAGMQPEPDYRTDPMAQGMKALPTPLRVASEATYGVAKSLPRLGAMAALGAAGVPVPIAGGAAFGITQEGLDPKEALIGAMLPSLGHYAGKAVEVMASKLGVTTDAALNILNKLGGAGGAASVLGGINEAEIRQLPEDQRAEARIQMAGSLLAQSALGMMGGRTPRVDVKYSTGEDLRTRVGAVPTPENVQFLERVEQPKRIISPEEKPTLTWEQEVVDAQKKILYGTTEEAALALERLKVLRGAVEPVPREGKLEEGETFPRSGISDTAIDKVVQQKGFAEPVPPIEQPTTTATDAYGGMELSSGIAPPSGGKKNQLGITLSPAALQAAARIASRKATAQGATLDDIYKIFEPEPKVKIPIKQKGINIIESVRTGLSSKFRPINKLAEDISKSYGLSSRKDIAGIMEQLKGSRGKGEAQVYRFDRDVSKLVKGDEKDFNAYMFLNRSLDRLRMDLKESAIPGANPRRSVGLYSIETLEPKLAALEQKLGPEKLAKFQQAATEYQRYLDDALKLQVESGRMSQDVYDTIKRDNQFYAPFKVMKYLEESMRPEGTGAKIDTVADYTKAMKGIEDPNFKLGDMLGAARQSILISRILADKAFAMRHVAELANIDTQGLFIKKMARSQDPPDGWSAVNVFENGKKVKYATRPEVADALQLYGDTGGGIVSQVLRGVSIPFKAGATALNIPFQVSNLMADTPRQALVSKYGIKGVSDLVRYPLDFVQSLYSSMSGDLLGRENKLFLDFLDSGAAGVTIQEHLTPKALQFREPTTMSKAKRVALNIIYSPAEFAAAIEQTSKILGVKRAMRIHGVKSGAELAKQFPEAITEIRRFSGSPDFGRQGKFVEAARLNLLYMFLNARIQGTVADVGRLTGRDGAKTAASTWFKVATAVGIPTAYLYYMNNSAEFKDDYDKRPQQEKDNYWLIPKSTFITNDQGEKMRDYWRIPKRESAKWISNMTESALEFAQKRDPKSFANFGQQMLEDISPVNIQGNTAQERLESVGASLNPVIKGPLELATGRDMYRHRQLVGDEMKKGSPEEQYTERTAEAFKKLAVAMPDIAPEFLRSPIMLENMTRNLTAGLITQFLKRKPVEGRTPFENMALLQRFQAVPYTDNEEFTKEMNSLERESVDEYLTRHRAATKIMEENKGKSLPDMFKGQKDPKLMKQVVDLWMAEKNGATYQDRRLIALPAKQRAEYVAKILAPLNKEERQKKILELSKRRVLTETVFQEMSLLPK